MKSIFQARQMNVWIVPSTVVSLLLFWMVLVFAFPSSVTQYLHTYYLGSFVAVLILYYLGFRFSGRLENLATLGLTMLLFGLTLSYLWSSGYSSNFIIGGLLPYKDAKNYYYGANLILSGLPLIGGLQATGRPLFPGILSSLLLVTGQNFRMALAVLVQLTGIGFYFSVRAVRHSMGALAASLYSTLSYFYIQPFLGYAMSEILGFMLGCIAFAIIWNTVRSPTRSTLLLSLLTLMVAISARPGAFFIFPMLILWAGWVFRKATRFSMTAAGVVSAAVILGYLAVNALYPRLIGVPAGSIFGNFAYAIYGQVKGGAGWHSAIQDLNTTNPIVVYRAALQMFLAHPLSFFIAVVKSYRDFFLPGDRSIFLFGPGDAWPLISLTFWALTMALILWGFFRMARNVRMNESSLLLAGFIGILLSIPFLPPIDGGGRFYASTMPFFFALPAAILGKSSAPNGQSTTLDGGDRRELLLYSGSAAVLLGATLVLPVIIFYVSSPPQYVMPICAAPQAAFAIKTTAASHLDLIPDGTKPCGEAPGICLSDFDKNGSRKANDDFYQELLSLAKSSESGIRITPSFNLIDTKFHYFVDVSPTKSLLPISRLVSGCATEIRTENQSIFQVESVTTP